MAFAGGVHGRIWGRRASQAPAQRPAVSAARRADEPQLNVSVGSKSISFVRISCNTL